jgi:hypothetical protein
MSASAITITEIKRSEDYFRLGKHMCLDVVCETEASVLWISGL